MPVEAPLEKGVGRRYLVGMPQLGKGSCCQQIRFAPFQDDTGGIPPTLLTLNNPSSELVGCVNVMSCHAMPCKAGSLQAAWQWLALFASGLCVASSFMTGCILSPTTCVDRDKLEG
jgi:hypothetical protein